MDLFKQQFEPKNVKTPKEIIDEQCEFLKQHTQGIVIGKVEPYSGDIYSKYDLFPALKMNSYNVQKNLGELSESKFKYEFFITSSNTPKYKYRAFFMEYGISIYPFKMVVDQALIDELFSNDEDENNGTSEILSIPSEEDFIDFLGKILNSSKITLLINQLMGLNAK